MKVLLIEPYGIEIAKRVEDNVCLCAPLIEPYGIEIQWRGLRRLRSFPFNRTLWN